MLPRSKKLSICLALIWAVISASLAGNSAQAIQYQPPVDLQEIRAQNFSRVQINNEISTTILPTRTVSPFTLVGVTWQGAIDATSTFQVRIREVGNWTTWQELVWSEDHSAEASEEQGARFGTDPLITGKSDAIEVRLLNSTGELPQDLRVILSNSEATIQDKNLISPRNLATNVEPYVTSPQGAVVARPRIISRAEWGANESWRDADAAMGTKILAGFMHHTASTNSYSPSEGPAQMRSLYSYYTKGLHYKDMAYSFLVDRYGNIYEGRSGCPRVLTRPCDGPSLPAVGAHTAAMNVNTFAVSVIGNYQTAKPSAQNLESIIDGVSAIMAWKIAPYGLKPDGFSDVPVGPDPQDQSRYSEGDLAHILTISGHRDVGRTVCPGQYLYPSLPAIRARINELLKPAVQDALVSPSALDVADETSVTLSAYVPAGSEWSMQVFDATGVTNLFTESGTAQFNGSVTSVWNRKDEAGLLVPSGKYKASISLLVNGVRLPAAVSTIVVGTKAALPIAITSKYRSKTKRTISWSIPASDLPTTFKYRIYSAKTKKWAKWQNISSSNVVLKKLVRNQKYRIELQGVNALGVSPVATFAFKHKK